MAQPRDYTRQYNFNDFATTDPASPLPGAQVDNELNAVKLTLDDLNTNIGLIQRDDGKIRNQTVHKDALDVDALALVTSGTMNPRGSWSSSNTYAIADIVDFNDATYFSTIAHTASNAFQTDLAANKWILIANAAIANTASAVDKFEGDGNTTAFTLSYTYTGNTDALVFVNGALRNPGDDYAISGTTVTFVTAPSSPSVAGNENVIIWGTSVVVAAAKQAAESAASNAQGYRDTAQEWASKTTGDVDSSGEYSSKAHAIGGTGVDAGTGSAKDWATKTGGTVGNTGEYSAKYYATLGDVGTIASNIGDINNVAGQIAPTNNISIVAGLQNDITAVAADQTDIGIVATDISAVQTAATNIQAIQDASGNATTATTQAGLAGISADTAEDYAVKTDGQIVEGGVNSGKYSAKAWANDGTGVTQTAGAGSAKQWAVGGGSTPNTNTAVDGTEFSAKTYAISDINRGVAGAHSAKDWASFVNGTDTVDGTHKSARAYAIDAANSVAGFDERYYGDYTSDQNAVNAHTAAGKTVQVGDLYYNSSDSALKYCTVVPAGADTDGTWLPVQATDTSSFATSGFALAAAIAL